MFVEDLENIHESMREDFVEYELDGKKGYADKGSVALHNSLKNAKSERKSYQEKAEEVANRLAALEAEQQKKIDDAANAAYEKAKADGDVDVIIKRYEQQLSDTEKRALARGKEEAEQEFNMKSATQKANSIVDSIGLTLGVDKDSGEALSDLIRGRVKIDATTGEEIYHDAKGSALSVDKENFIAELKKEKRFSRLIKAELITKSPAKANGSVNYGSAYKDPKKMNSSERLEFKERDPAGFKIAFNL